MAIKREDITFENRRIPLYSMNTLVIGSGAAGLNAAFQLYERGQRDVAIVTEQWGGGTSFNAGSDKQTYYKLSLAGAAPDSPRQMAADLHAGGCAHGDVALCEAQHSAEAFFNLVRLGVPFPHDRYGAYVGYRTDHDPLGRGTSAGPFTSRFMGEYLGAAVCDRGIPVLDDHVVVALLWSREQGQKRVRGALAIDRGALDSDTGGFVLFNANNVVLATGGPGGMYAASVYPRSQTGSIGLALAIGAAAHNLTESQFGMASTPFRWNVSGSYQQVIPRYFSTDARGGDTQDFVNEFFPDMPAMAGAIFRKGYQWPFDASRVRNHGSSLIDILVHRETVLRGRRVFLDYRQNPAKAFGLEEFSLDLLDDEAHAYLEKSRALLPRPIDRLQAMNPQAAALFGSKGIDLEEQPLEIAICAQHNNGGLIGNIWWESNVKHLFPIGEVNGTHGVRRPGGSALNAGQVGALRAATFIAKRYGDRAMDTKDFLQRIAPRVLDCFDFVEKISGREETSIAPQDEGVEHLLPGAASDAGGLGLLPEDVIAAIEETMSRCGAHIRDPKLIERAVGEAWELKKRLDSDLRVTTAAAVPDAFRARELCLTHIVYLEALREYLAKGGRSRGAALILDPSGQRACEKLGERWRFSLAESDDFVNAKILEIRLGEQAEIETDWVDIRPIPDEDVWFETVWDDYVEDRIFKEEAQGG